MHCLFESVDWKLRFKNGLAVNVSDVKGKGVLVDRWVLRWCYSIVMLVASGFDQRAISKCWTFSLDAPTSNPTEINWAAMLAAKRVSMKSCCTNCQVSTLAWNVGLGPSLCERREIKRDVRKWGLAPGWPFSRRNLLMWSDEVTDVLMAAKCRQSDAEVTCFSGLDATEHDWI